MDKRDESNDLKWYICVACTFLVEIKTTEIRSNFIGVAAVMSLLAGCEKATYGSTGIGSAGEAISYKGYWLGGRQHWFRYRGDRMILGKCGNMSHGV